MALCLQLSSIFIGLSAALSIAPYTPEQERCFSLGQCYSPITKSCGYMAPCPNRNYCGPDVSLLNNVGTAPTCNAYPDAPCKFTGCGGCFEYFTDWKGEVIQDCDADVCTLPVEIGPCRASFTRYFYNKKMGRCEPFIYGGCHGNANNFATYDECKQSCGHDIVPACVPAGYTFMGDPQLCARMKYFCNTGTTYWWDGTCGCGCKPL